MDARSFVFSTFNVYLTFFTMCYIITGMILTLFLNPNVHLHSALNSLSIVCQFQIPLSTNNFKASWSLHKPFHKQMLCMFCYFPSSKLFCLLKTIKLAFKIHSPTLPMHCGSEIPEKCALNSTRWKFITSWHFKQTIFKN